MLMSNYSFYGTLAVRNTLNREVSICRNQFIGNLVSHDTGIFSHISKR